MRTSTCSSAISVFISPMGISPTSPIAESHVNPSNIALGLFQLPDRFQKKMKKQPQQASLNTRWGNGQYITGASRYSREKTTTFTFDKIDGRPDDRVTLRIGNVGIDRQSSSDVRLLSNCSREHGIMPVSPKEEISGIAFTYEAGRSARLSQLAVIHMDSIAEGRSLTLGIYHLKFSTEFLRKLADANQTDEELNRLAKACEQGAKGPYGNDGIAHLGTERDSNSNIPFDAAFMYALDIGVNGYDQPIHPLISSLIEGASRLIPNLMAI